MANFKIVNCTLTKTVNQDEYQCTGTLKDDTTGNTVIVEPFLFTNTAASFYYAFADTNNNGAHQFLMDYCNKLNA